MTSSLVNQSRGTSRPSSDHGAGLRAYMTSSASPSPSPSPSPRILLFGAGAVGSIYTYLLSRALPTPITVICRSNFTAVSTSGFHITSTLFGTVSVRPTVLRSISDAPGPWDYLVITSKALPGTAALIAPAVGPETTIVLAQNGIDIELEYRERFPDNPILSCVVYLPTRQPAPGVIEMGHIELLEIGTFPADAPAAHKALATSFAALIRAGGGSATVHDDIQAQRWKKLLINAAWNPICALARIDDVGFLMAAVGNEAVVREVMMEVAGVAMKSGYGDVDEGVVEWQLGRAVARIGGKGI